jgi:hypothetical protein
VGFALLFALSGLALLAALAVAVRAQLRGRAEELIAVTLVWNAIIITPIYVLGLTGHLRRAPLAVGSLLMSSAVFALTARDVGWRALLSQSWGVLGGLMRLPLDALILSWRPRRFIVLGVVFLGLVLPYLALSAYFAQPFTNWDPLWYHDTMVGFSIQNHGFKMVDLPETLQKVNGYVRLGEMTQLWLVIFADRRLADIANLLFAPAIAASAYALTRRYTTKVVAMGWGVAVVLMPSCLSLLHSTYVDPQNAGLLLGGIVFGTIDRPRMRDGLLAALGLALAIGSKGLSLVPVPVAALIAAVFLLRTHWQFRRREAIWVVVGGAALIIAMAAATYFRNYLAFHNPFWPDMGVELPKLGIHWPGQGPWASDPMRKGLPVNLNEPLPKLLEHLYALPWSVKGMYFDQAVDYGIGFTWVAIPLGVIAFVACWVIALRRRLGHPVVLERTAPPVALAIILAAMVAGSPALWGPRYQTPAVALLVALVGWLTARPAWERLSEPAVSMVLVTSLMMFSWTPLPRWWLTPDRMLTLMRTPFIERELSRELGAPTVLSTGLAREQELKPGSLLVFNDLYGGFPSLFWNNTFSNRVKYLKSGPDFLARAIAADATWIFIDDRDSTQLKAARAAGSGWQEVGILNAVRGGSAFRRAPAGPTPSPAPAPVAKPAPALPAVFGPPWPPATPPPAAPVKTVAPSPPSPVGAAPTSPAPQGKGKISTRRK